MRPLLGRGIMGPLRCSWFWGRVSRLCITSHLGWASRVGIAGPEVQLALGRVRAGGNKTLKCAQHWGGASGLGLTGP